MIEKPTVFVLGAGAHCSYGFPSGRKLKQEIVATVRSSLQPSDNYSLLRLTTAGLGIPVEEVQQARVVAFANALERSGQGSIDAFLNANRHQSGFDTIGKAAIAQILLEREHSANATNDDWLSYLFEVMIDGVDNPSDFINKNKVYFITFNYDRFLERWLFEKLWHSFGLDEVGAKKIFSNIIIHHVYGSLGSTFDTIQPASDAWMSASRNIRTIFDTEKYHQAISESKTLLQNAEVVCLLGYGFHRENTELLELIQSINKDNCLVASTRFELQDAEWNRLTRPFAEAGVKIHDALLTQKCLDAMKILQIF